MIIALAELSHIYLTVLKLEKYQQVALMCTNEKDQLKRKFITANVARLTKNIRLQPNAYTNGQSATTTTFR